MGGTGEPPGAEGEHPVPGLASPFPPLAFLQGFLTDLTDSLKLQEIPFFFS